LLFHSISGRKPSRDREGAACRVPSKYVSELLKGPAQLREWRGEVYGPDALEVDEVGLHFNVWDFVAQEIGREPDRVSGDQMPAFDQAEPRRPDSG